MQRTRNYIGGFLGEPILPSGWIISNRAAGKLAKPYGGCPKHGYEKLIEVDGKSYWLARTKINRKHRWWIREKT